ncbi:hypothetical protein WJX84_000061 [Apatococcus fuscideae]|uniref:Autophagy-related protein 9 n=1 Tax=Apatococcus fuscideae TaxID=2026836 RepID=A0AAW1TBJ0_9CHLO
MICLSAIHAFGGDLSVNPELLGRESYEWSAIANLDHFFTRIYRYYEEKGFSTIATARICNLLALGFTVCFSGFLLMVVDWHGVLHAACLFENTCEIQEVGIVKDPWGGPWTALEDALRHLSPPFLCLLAVQPRTCLGVLALNVPTPGMRKRFMLTQTLEWNLQWCLFDCMFDERFRIRRDFLYSPVALQRRFKASTLSSL